MTSPSSKRLRQISFAILLLMMAIIFDYIQSRPTTAPNAVFTTIKGEEISMVSLKGKVVLVNFWASDCKSCVAEMPELITTYEQYHAKGFEVIAVAMPYDPPGQVVAYAEQKHLPFPVMHDGYGDISRQFGDVNVTPTAYLYNQAGERIQSTVGTLNFKQLHTLLDRELSKQRTNKETS